MQPKTLKFRAVGMALVQDHDALEAGIRKYLGREAQDADGGPVTSVTTRVAWAPSGEVEVPYLADYVAACKAGDLEAVDAETAKACGVAFGEQSETLTGDGSGEALPLATEDNGERFASARKKA